MKTRNKIRIKSQKDLEVYEKLLEDYSTGKINMSDKEIGEIEEAIDEYNRKK